MLSAYDYEDRDHDENAACETELLRRTGISNDRDFYIDRRISFAWRPTYCEENVSLV